VEDGTGAATVGGDTVDTNTIGTYIITYDHTDTNGNAAVQVTRTVNVVSGSAPVISLIGSSFITLEVGSGAYVEQGATATDTEDGDLTGDIVIGGDTVDTNTIGVYMVTYNVTDTNGNPATQVTRTINVVDSVVIEGTTLGINKNILFSI
jgi:phage protein D